VLGHQERRAGRPYRPEQQDPRDHVHPRAGQEYGPTEAILKEFYSIETVKVGQLQPSYYSAGTIIDTETGEELVKAGAQIGEALSKIQASKLKKSM